jgi:hypothetical protein
MTSTVPPTKPRRLSRKTLALLRRADTGASQTQAELAASHVLAA